MKFKLFRTAMALVALTSTLALMPMAPAAAKSGIAPMDRKSQEGGPGESAIYSVKFLCGYSRGKIVPKGKYVTTLNVHNISAEPAVLRLHSAQAGEHLNAGPVSKILEWTIQSGEVIAITCKDIWWLNYEHHKYRFFDGFVVLDASTDLQVVALNGGSQVSIDKLP